MKLTPLLLSSSITLTQSFVVHKSAQHGSSNISLEAVNNRRSFLQIAAPFSAFLLSNVLVAYAEESSVVRKVFGVDINYNTINKE